MGGAEVVLLGGRIWHGDGPEASSPGGQGAGRGILERDGLGGLEAELGEHGEVEIGRRLGLAHILATADHLEPGEQSDPGKMAVDVAVGGVGCNAELESLDACCIEEVEHAGEDGLAHGHFAVQFPMFQLQDGPVGLRAECRPGIEFDADMPDEAERAGAGIGEAGLIMDRRPGVDQRSFGVDDESVEVEDQRANHAPFKPRKGGSVKPDGGIASRGSTPAQGSVIFGSMQKRVLPTGIRSLTLAMTTLISALAVAARPTSHNRAEIPAQYKWDLAPIFADWPAWEEGMKAIDAKMAAFAALKGSLAQGPQAVLHAYRLYDEIGMLQDRIYNYPSLQRDLDTRNQETGGRFQRVQALFAKFGTATAWFTPELLAVPQATMEQWIGQTPELGIYRFTILDNYRVQKHVLDEKGERLLSFSSRANETARSAFQELSTSDIKFPKVTLADGKDVTLTPGAYQAILATNYNQADRAKAFEAYLKTYAATANTYAALYNGVLQRDWFLAQARNYPTSLDAALDGNNIPTAVVETLVATTRTGTAPLQRYLKLRQRLLGLATYHLYDNGIPIFKIAREYPYDAARQTVIDSVAPLGADYQARMRKLFAGGCLDVYENDGKRSGAYSAGVYGVGPYMLLNYNDTMDAMFTFAHEAGHSMHTILAFETQPYVTANYTIFVAEVASTMNERLLLRKLLETTTDPKERFVLVQHAVDNIVGTFYTQVLFANFELEAHRLAEQGQPITVDVLKEIYGRLLRDYYGDAVAPDELYRYTWARIPHFYNSPYYVYQYATCFASSAQLYRTMNTGTEAERAAATARYLDLLKSGGSDHPMALLRKAGVDLARPATVQAVVDQMDELVTQLETEAAKIQP